MSERREMGLERKNASKVMGMITFILFVISYVTGVLNQHEISDYLLVVALCFLDNLFVWFVINEKEEKEYLIKLKQITVLQILAVLLITSTLIYRKETFTYEFVTVFLIVSAYMVLFLCFFEGWKHRQQISADTVQCIRTNWSLIGICVVFTLLSASEVVSVSQWDATFYLSSLDDFAATFDLTFKTIGNSNMGGHLSAGYSLIAGTWHMLINKGNIGVKLCNIFMGWIGIICFDRILRRCGIKAILRTFGTALFALSPMFLGTIGVISVDYALMIYGLVFIASYMDKRWILATASAVLLLFSKETAVVIYFFFWLGIFLSRNFRKKAGKHWNWRDTFCVFSVEEWKLIGLPTAFFLILFAAYSMGGIGWPASLLAGKNISAKLILAGVLLLILILVLIILWISLYHIAKYQTEKLIMAAPVIIMIVGMAVVFAVFPEIRHRMVINDIRDFNRVGISKQHLLMIFKQAYILNFSWLIVLFVIIGFWRGRGRWKNRPVYIKELIVAVVMTDMGLVLFTMVYVTYQNPRYLQLHYALLILLLTVVWGDIWIARQKKYFVLNRAVFGFIIGLVAIESFWYIDPLTIHAFYNRDIGNGVLCGGDTAQLGVISTCYSDRVMSNRVYAYYMKNIEKFLKDIEFDGTQRILFSPCGKWGALGRRDLANLDKELKCIISYDGSIADSVNFIKKVEDIETYRNEEEPLYYISIGFLYPELDNEVAALCTQEQTKVYTTGSWALEIYKLGE